MDQKIKTAAGKVPMHLIPLRALRGVARVFAYGARKYVKGNWYRANDTELCERYVGGLLRHLSDAQNPDGTFDFKSLAAVDPESGLPELDHAICGLIMLRGLLEKHGVLASDPGIGNEPPSSQTSTSQLEIQFQPVNGCVCEQCAFARLNNVRYA